MVSPFKRAEICASLYAHLPQIQPEIFGIAAHVDLHYILILSVSNIHDSLQRLLMLIIREWIVYTSDYQLHNLALLIRAQQC